jgi:hypothetical protein
MRNPLSWLKQALGTTLQRLGRLRPRPHSDVGFVAGSRAREIAQASPERAGELAGHAVERVET